MNQRVLVASNRGPVSYQFGADGSLTGSRGGGGMIAGVTDGLAALGPGASATWICAALSDADRAVARSQETGPRDEKGIPVRMLDIAPDTFDRAYNNVANSTLWFLLHQLFDTPNQPRFGREFRRDWESYLAYNEAFADALTEEALTGRALTLAGEGGLRVLIQDYHLCLAPRLLRDRLGGRPGDARRRAASGTSATRPGRRRTTTGCSRTRSAGRCSTASSARTGPAFTPSGGPPRSWTAAPPCWART